MFQEVIVFYYTFVRWIHLLCTLSFNFLVLGDVEMLIGWFPVSVIYLGSGFAGNIFGAIFIPYRPEVRAQHILTVQYSTWLVQLQ